MKPQTKIIIISISFVIIASCKSPNKDSSNMKAVTKSSYGSDITFLKDHTEIIELKRNNACIALAPLWQGRVMTSSANGKEGLSFGWINRGLIGSHDLVKHINAFGGEERFWLGPEGGQFSLFFPEGAEFSFDNWQTPGFIDTEPYKVEKQSDTNAVFTCDAVFNNYSGTKFSLHIERNIEILDREAVRSLTGADPGPDGFVAYRSDNKITNTGKEKWDPESGLISIWMLGMMNPSPGVVVVAPYLKTDSLVSVPVVNDNYFGKISSDRLKTTDSHIIFSADGRSRGKIGIPPARSAGVIGSYDTENNTLTIVMTRKPLKGEKYVNSAWEIQEDPYSGDAINSYNDGPLEDGSQMGPFYELETSSPALSLAPGEHYTHTQYTIHYSSNPEVMNMAAEKVLRISLEKITCNSCF